MRFLPGNPDFFAALGRVAESVGNRTFYHRALKVVAGLVPSDMRMVMRYGRIAAPEFLVIEGLDQAAVELYLSGFYRLDPFFRYWREHERGDVVVLRDVLSPSLAASDYIRVFAPKARIADDLGMFFPVPGRAAIALFVEKHSGQYSDDDVAVLRLVLPTLLGLHKAHVSRLFADLAMPKGQGSWASSTRPVLVTDRRNKRIFENDAWRGTHQHFYQIKELLAAVRERPDHQIELAEGAVLCGESLEEDFPIAPQGWLYTVEEPGGAPISYDDALNSFFAAELTPREREIVKLIILGHSSEAIAATLGIGKGTVKNHRRRLYFKLDVTSERELFSLFFDYLRSGPASSNQGMVPAGTIDAVRRRPLP